MAYNYCLKLNSDDFSVMQYHGGHELLEKLSTLLKSHGDLILRQESQLCLTATSLVFLNHCFELISSGRQDSSEGVIKTRGFSNRDKDSIAFILDFLRQTPSLRLVQGTCSHFDGLINISCFRALQVLEIKKVPIGLIRGFQGLRPQIKTLICRRALISLNEVFVYCGGDQLNAPFAWPHLENVDFSYNGIEQLDDSVKLLPKLRVLNLSHNNIHHTEDDDSHSVQYLSGVQHLNLGFNQLDCIPVLSGQAGMIKFQLTTLVLRNNNLHDLKGIQIFTGLRFLDVSFNCIASLSELTPLAHLHNLISLNLQGNPVVFCPYYRRATIACLYPVPRVEPVQIDGKPLDSEERALLGRNVHPVSMLSYIPEDPVRNPRVREVKKVAEDLMESSESQEESDTTPKKQKNKRRSKKGKKLIPREIDFEEDSEVVSHSEDPMADTSCSTPTQQILEHEDDVEKLKKLRQLGGEDWLPSISQVVHDEVFVNPSVERPEPQPDQAPNVVHRESVPSFSEDKLEINSPTSSISNISEGDFSESHHFLVTLVATPEDDDGEAVPLFVTVKGEFVVEKNFAGKVISQLETSCLQGVHVDRAGHDHDVIHLEFDYINPERRTRDYVMESNEDASQFAEILKPFVAANKQIKESAAERYQCLKCSAEFPRPENSDDSVCPDCGSSMIVQVSSPEQTKPVVPLRSIEDYLREHAGASTLNSSSVKTLNGDMSVTALVTMSSSSSSSSYQETVEQLPTQEPAETDSASHPDNKNLFTGDKEQVSNFPGTEQNPDVIPKSTEALDQCFSVPDLCASAGDGLSVENGQETSQKTENVQNKFVINNSGNYKVAAKTGKYTLTEKTIKSTKVRTSALSSSLKELKIGKSPPAELDKQVLPKRNKSIEDVVDGIPSTQRDRKFGNNKSELRDTVPKLRDADRRLRDNGRKLHGHNRKAERLSHSLPTYGDMTTKSSTQGPSARKRSDQSYFSAQRKISKDGSTNSGTPKTIENVTQQPVARSPTPKMFFTNLINRLGVGRLSGNSPSTSSADSRSSSSSSSRASTPALMEQNVALSFRLSVDEFQSCDHKLKLYFEVSLFRWGSHEEFSCLLKAPVVVYGSTEETPSLMIASNVMFYLCRFSLRGSGTPDDCLTPLVSHPLDDLRFIDCGLGGQSFRLEFSRPGACYEFLVREKDRCETFLKLLINTVQQANIKAGSKPVVINPPHPQILAHIRSQVLGNKAEDVCSLGERLQQQVVNFSDPPLVKDRKSLLRSYSSCFVGREFVDWMVRVREVESRDEAVEIGQQLLDAGALEHVSKEQQFEDKDQYYRFNTESYLAVEAADAAEATLAGDGDMDTSVVLFIMAHRCTDSTNPHSSLDAVSVVVSRSHIAVVKQNPQWPVPRYAEMPQNLKGPAFVCLARHKITDVTSLDFYEDDPCFMGISITDEDAPADCADSQWILKTETVSTLSSLVKVIKVPWEAQFGVELQKNLYPSITDHKM